MTAVEAEGKERTGKSATPAIAFTALRTRFLRRTVTATVLTLVLVAMTATAYGYPRWGGYYLFMGLGTLLFLGLTPLVLKAMLFDRRPAVGLLLIGAKVILLLVMFVALDAWSRREPGRLLLGTALVAGGVTPLAVVVLRVLGGAMGPQPDDGKSKREEGKP